MARFNLIEGYPECRSAVVILESIGYEELDPFLDEQVGENLSLFVDNKRKHFWFIAPMSIRHTQDLVKDIYDEIVNTITLKEIEAWK